MAKIRGEEAWASQCISSALGGVQVKQHDDGSKPGMFDLEIAYVGRPPGAVEVTAAADAQSIGLWNIVKHGHWVEPSLVGGWSVELLPEARAPQLRARILALLGQLEQQGIREVRVGPGPCGTFEKVAHSLGIVYLLQSGTNNPGSIYLHVRLSRERSGGVVAETGDALADWLSEWIHKPKQAHNLEKLGNSGADERHLFVILPGFADAPFAATDLLMRDGAPLPTIAPNVPDEVTHLWIMSTWDTGDGMRWSRDCGWRRFQKVVSPRNNNE